MKDEDQMKPWVCPGDRRHVLGQVVRAANGTRLLLLYRLAIVQADQPETDDPEEEQPQVDIIACIEGYVADVRCSVCGAVRTWVPGEEAMKILLERARRQR